MKRALSMVIASIVLFGVLGCACKRQCACQGCPACAAQQQAMAQDQSQGYPQGYPMGNQMGNQQAAPPQASVAYPYYTLRGPRDFFAKNPQSIGP